VIETFKDRFAAPFRVRLARLEVRRDMRLDTTLQYLKDNFAEPAATDQAWARKAGFSVPAFRPHLKQATGYVVPSSTCATSARARQDAAQDHHAVSGANRSRRAASNRNIT